MRLNPGTLQPLLEQFAGTGQVLSCYVNLGRPAGPPLQWPGPLKAKVTAVRKVLANDEAALAGFERNFAAIGTAPAASPARHGAAMAIFSALQRGFFHAVALDGNPLENELIVDSTPYLVPLLMAFAGHREYLAIHADTHRGRLYAVGVSGARLLAKTEADVPPKQHSAGQCWGTEQATIARHREDRILHFRKELERLIEHTWAKGSFDGLALFGDHQAVEHLRKCLPKHLAAGVVFEGPLEWQDKPLSAGPAMCSALAEVAEAEHDRVLAALEEQLASRHAVAAGPRAALEALQGGRIGCRGHGYLVVGPDPREVVGRCTGCRTLSPDMPSVCPRCQAPCAEANLWEEILLFALRHDIKVHDGTGSAALTRCGGMAAVLPEGVTG